MNPTRLRLRRGERPLRPAVAWFLPGNDVRAWLNELLHWHVPQTSLLLRLVPQGRGDRSPRGVLVTTSSSTPPHVARSAIPYGLLAGRLYLPVEGWLDPQVTEAELVELLSSESEYLFHPASGLVRFEPAERLGLAELLRPGTLRAQSWNGASPGLNFPSRLLSITPELPLTFEAILRQGRDDIGTLPPALKDLPPAPNEPSAGILAELGRHLQEKLARALKRLTELAPRTALHPTWVNRLEDWANRQLRQVQESLLAARNREIQRLLHLLATNPDVGLRFALPMGGGAPRGVGAPGDRLLPREVNFNLDRLGGGGPSDLWDLPQNYFNELVQRYRQLAEREVALGRHRRAAYIYAELLNDLQAAALTLKAGHHWREAAILYEKRLNQIGSAIECLEKGGLLPEAIALAETHQSYEKAADLSMRLELREQAERLYRQAIAIHLRNGDRVNAARLLHEKLHLSDEALQVLADGWPQSSQANDCLRGVFRLLAQGGQHQETQKWLTTLRTLPLSVKSEEILMEILADLAQDYPDRTVQHQAGDCARVRTARLLPEASAGLARKLLAAISRLAPQDRLLDRDCMRYLTQRERRSQTPRLSGRRRTQLIATLPLNPQVRWQRAVAGGDHVYLAGWKGTELVLGRCHPSGTIEQTTLCQLPAPEKLDLILLAVHPEDESDLLVHLPSPAFSTTSMFPGAMGLPFCITCGSLLGLSANTVGLLRSTTNSLWHVDIRNEHLTLIGLSAERELLTTYPLPMPVEWSSTPDLRSQVMLPLPVHDRGTTVFAGVHDMLLSIKGRNEIDMLATGGVIRQVVSSPPQTVPRVLLAQNQGCAIFWDDPTDGRLERFAHEMEAPCLCLTRGGHVVVATRHERAIYQTGLNRLEHLHTLPGGGSPPVAVLALRSAHQFAVCGTNGEVAFYQLPSPAGE